MTTTERKPPVFSDEQKALMEASDDALWSKAKVLSFDVAELKKRLSDGDPFSNIIHCHLYADHILTKFLSKELINSSALAVDRLSFAQKLGLCDALIGIDKDLKGFLKKLNGVRNKIVHRLDFEITDKVQMELKTCVGKDVRDQIVSESKLAEFPGFLAYMIVLFDIYRQNRHFWHLKNEQHALGMRSASYNAWKVLKEIRDSGLLEEPVQGKGVRDMGEVEN